MPSILDTPHLKIQILNRELDTNEKCFLKLQSSSQKSTQLTHPSIRCFVQLWPRGISYSEIRIDNN